MAAPLLEICVDSLEGALAAASAGADRLEVCSDLIVGGTTPSMGLLRAVRAAVDIPLVALVRPRPGDFHHGDGELRVMEEDLQACLGEGIEGAAIGVLATDGTYDRQAMERLARAGEGLELVAHRAFDLARDPLDRLEELVQMGYRRVLTSGGEARALDGAPLLARLVQAAAGRIEVLAGGGVREEDVVELVQASGVSQVHASASRWNDGPMEWRPAGPPMSLDRMPGEHERRGTAPDRVQALRELLDGLEDRTDS